MDNTIFTHMDDTIGYYEDIYKGFNEVIEDALKDKDTETAQEQLEYLNEVNEYKDFDGLLVCSMNNGMGFTCEPLVRVDLIASEIKKELAENGVKLTDAQYVKVIKTIARHFEERGLK